LLFTLVPVASAEPLAVLYGDVEGSDPNQSGVIAVASGTTCTTTSPVSGPSGPDVPYETHPFTNDTGGDACFKVDYAPGTSANVMINAYLGAFDPSNPRTNFLGGPSATDACSGGTPTFSFVVPAGATYVVVASSCVPGNDSGRYGFVLDVDATALVPAARLSTSSVDFGSVAIGSTSGPGTISITNFGDAGSTLAFTAAQISGPDAADFAIVSDSCVAGGALLAVDASCSMDLAFTPGATGALSATLSISDNTAGSPHLVQLSGVGVTPSADLAVGISAATGSGKAKGRVTYTITVYNAGPSSALDLLLNDTLSSQTTFVSVVPSRGSCLAPLPGASGVVSCSLGSLSSGSSGAVQIVVTAIVKKGYVTNTVSVSSSTIDPNLANNTASITTSGR
jgi:uncharacterized repeat protein (TIGR01451 family)